MSPVTFLKGTGAGFRRSSHHGVLEPLLQGFHKCVEVDQLRDIFVTQEHQLLQSALMDPSCVVWVDHSIMFHVVPGLGQATGASIKVSHEGG